MLRARRSTIRCFMTSSELENAAEKGSPETMPAWPEPGVLRVAQKFGRVERREDTDRNGSCCVETPLMSKITMNTENPRKVRRGRHPLEIAARGLAEGAWPKGNMDGGQRNKHAL